MQASHEGKTAVNGFLPSYHDPIFSIIIMILIAVAVALVMHGWNLYRREKLTRSLYGFLEKFDSTECSLETENVPFEEGMAKPLLMLAKAFEQSGHYDKTISICLYLIRHTRDDELLIYLGSVYLRAGFLQRAEEVFLEIIARHPRRKDVLNQLELLYESMQEYDKAREALDALRAQGEETALREAYLEFLELHADTEKSPAEKAQILTEKLEAGTPLYRPLIKELFALDTRKAWEAISQERIPRLLDLLWFLPHAQLQLDIISKNPTLQALYYARGDLEEAPEKPSGIFALEMMTAARKGGYKEGDLSFSYLCTRCKRSYPVSFVRCPGCMSLDTLQIKERLVQKRPMRGDTLF